MKPGQSASLLFFFLCSYQPHITAASDIAEDGESKTVVSATVQNKILRQIQLADPIFLQQAYLKASNTDAADNFGWSVAVSGDTLVVGSFGEDSAATGVNGDGSDNSAQFAGAVYVFQRDFSGNWSQQAYLKPLNMDANDSFGAAVAIDSDILVVGAPGEAGSSTGVNGAENNMASSAGAAYVFVRDGTGSWGQQAYLKASNTDANDGFGKSVAISGNTVIVGAPYEASASTTINANQTDNTAGSAGAAYVFVQDAGGNWTQQAYLKAPNAEARDEFGYAVDIDGDSAVVGSWKEDSASQGVGSNAADNSAPYAGAAYVFTRDTNGNWSFQSYLKASNTDSVDYFGRSVAISGDTVAVGAYGESSFATGINGDPQDNQATSAGAAYVFVRDVNGNWSQQAYVKASNTDAGDLFGYSVALDSDALVVGARSESSNATTINGDGSNNLALGSGAAYWFVRDGAGNWTQQAYLKAFNSNDGDDLGFSVAISGKTVVAGAIGESSAATGVNNGQTDNSAINAGAAYVFLSTDTLFADGFE